jgi:tetratricopeptide (TPR) repeat protein
MIGKTLRQYVINRPLGQGGMGEVWLARDTTLDRDVALKILPAGGFDSTTRKERFFREAKAASALNHPNIITIYEINSADGIDFIAMEYVQGHTLGEILKRGPMAIDRVEHYAAQMAAAVGRAHRANIVHRDLKPGNIMITDEGLLKVLDFGIAKITTPIADASAETIATDTPRPVALTREGTTIGTLGYMSPEQAIGDPVDARSDVFSFGVILYEMLTDRLPFPGKTRSEVLRQMHVSPPPPLAALRPDVPARLSDLVTRCLEMKPEDRFANLTDVAAVLTGGAANDAATAAYPAPSSRISRVGTAVDAPFDSAQGRPGPQPVAEPQRVRGYWRQLPLVVRIAIVIVVVSAIGPLRSRLRTWGDTPPAAGASADAATVPDMTREAATLLSRSDRDGNPDRAIALLEKVLAADPNSAIAYAHLSTAYGRKQASNPDPQWMKMARETAQHAVDLNTDLAAGRVAKGFAHAQAGERAEAETEFRKAVDLDPMNPWPYIGLGVNFDGGLKDAEAEAAFKKAVQLGPQEWRAFADYAQFCYRRARYAEATTLWESALKVTPDNATIMRNLGASYYYSDRPNEAASSLQRALEIRPTAPIYTNLGNIRFFQGRYLDAVNAFEKAVEQAPNNNLYWGNLGDGLRWAAGRRKDAPAAYKRAVELIDDQIAKKPGDSDLESRRALYLIKMGQRDAAIKEAATVAARPNLTAQMLYRITVIYELAGDRARALESLGKALKAGYAKKDLANEPELTSMRADVRYHRVIDTIPAPAK